MAFAHQTRVLLVMTAQVVLSAVFIGGYFLVLWLFMKGQVGVPETYKDSFLTVLGVLTAGVMLILNFWFSRHREQTPPSATG